MGSHMIKLITFDLDHTLWDVDPVIIKAEQKMRAWVAQHLPEAVAHLEMDQLKGVYKHLRDQHPELLHHPTNFRKKLLHTVFSQLDISHDHALDMTEQAFQVFYEGRNDIELFHEAENILQQLSQRFPLIALSNGNANLKMVGIDQYFVGHYSAETEGKAKPHQAMFLRALEHVNATPQQAIHIGDNPKEDVEAARAAGYNTIWFNENNKQAEGLCNPTREIHHLNQLLQAVDAIEKSAV